MFHKALDLYFVINVFILGKVPRKNLKFVDQICRDLFTVASESLVSIGYFSSPITSMRAANLDPEQDFEFSRARDHSGVLLAHRTGVRSELGTAFTVIDFWWISTNKIELVSYQESVPDRSFEFSRDPAHRNFTPRHLVVPARASGVPFTVAS